VNGRKILCQKEIPDFQIIVERSGKTGTDQTVELLILQKFSESLSANLLANAGMKNFNRAILDLAANCSDTIAVSSGFVAEQVDEFRAFGRQSKRDRNHDVILSWQCIGRSVMQAVAHCRTPKRGNELEAHCGLGVWSAALLPRFHSGGTLKSVDINLVLLIARQFAQ